MEPSYASAYEDASWLESVADRVLTTAEGKESFLNDALTPVSRSALDFRNQVRGIVRRNRGLDLRDISRSLGFLVVWPPGSAIQLGDVGVFPLGSLFVVETHLSALGVAFHETDAAPAGPYNYRIPEESAQLQSVYSRTGLDHVNSALFSATGCVSRRIADLTELASNLVGLGDAWNERWSVVTEVVEAHELEFLVSADGDVSVARDGGVAGTIDCGRTAAVRRRPVAARGDMRQPQSDLSFPSSPGDVALYRVARLHRSTADSGLAVHELTVVRSYDDL